MINRKIQPELSPIGKIDFIAPEIHPINDTVSLYHTKDVSDETSRFDLYFDAGSIYSSNSIASFVNGMLLSGTADKSSIEIHEKINSLGGYIESGISSENATFSIYCLRENLLELFSVVYDAINNLVFDEKEIEELRKDRIQKMKISLEKVGQLARREFQQQLFHSDERYAQTAEIEHYQSISRDKLVDFHKQHILNGLKRVVIVGNIAEDEINQVISLSKTWASDRSSQKATQLQNKIGVFQVAKDGAMQSAIRVGRTLFNKKHEDYLDFLVLNTLFGDYFGSRLMANIREDKGYTYGIGSMLGELENTGFFLIATEVRADAKEDTLHQIRLEMEKLQNELVPEHELELVKNYMLGQLLKSADGPYAMTDLYLSAILQGKDLELYNQAIERVQNITAERIQELANAYFKWEDMTIVIAG